MSPTDPRFPKAVATAYLEHGCPVAVARHLGAKVKRVRATLEKITREKPPEFWHRDGFLPLPEAGYCYAVGALEGQKLCFAYAPDGAYVGHGASVEEANTLAIADRKRHHVPDPVHWYKVRIRQWLQEKPKEQ